MKMIILERGMMQFPLCTWRSQVTYITEWCW